MVEEIAPHNTLQYESPRAQADTAIAGMWLFLASELLFFGGLLLAFVFLRHQHRAGFAEAAGHTNLWIGAINTVLLLTSSLALTAGVIRAGRTSQRFLLASIAITAALGTAFLILKAYEWRSDLIDGLLPGPGFALAGTPDGGGAFLFFVLYFVATGLHGLHMLVGIGLLAWLGLRARTGAFDPPARGEPYTTPVEVVGLYWSFVDMVWLLLFPTLYLIGRAA